MPEALVAAGRAAGAEPYICASRRVAQHAALACFEPASRSPSTSAAAPNSSARRDFFVPALERLGLPVPVVPDGAFYAWADCSSAASASRQLGLLLRHDAARARRRSRPGATSASAETARFVRFSTANSMAHLQEAVARLERVLG